MPKTEKTPASVLQSLIDEYQINPFALSKNAHLDYQTVRKILYSKGKITVPTALKLGKYFGQSPAYWIDVQIAAEINALSKNKKFVSGIKGISKVQKPAAKAKTPARGKTKTLSVKRKKAAKTPGARGTKRRRARS